MFSNPSTVVIAVNTVTIRVSMSEIWVRQSENSLAGRGARTAVIVRMCMFTLLNNCDTPHISGGKETPVSRGISIGASIRGLRGKCKSRVEAAVNCRTPYRQCLRRAELPQAAQKRYGMVSMGKHTIRFRCQHCAHCCTDVVCLVTPWDVVQIVRKTGVRTQEFLEFLFQDEISGVPLSDPTWIECNGRRYIMALRRDDQEGCFFLDKHTKQCFIYPSRPIVCRLYPFRLEETRTGGFRGFSLHRTGVGCPRQRGDVFVTGPLYALYLEDLKHQEDYQDLVAAFNRRQDADKQPADFASLFVEEVRIASSA